MTQGRSMQIISMIKWIRTNRLSTKKRTNRLSIKNSLCRVQGADLFLLAASVRLSYPCSRMMCESSLRVVQGSGFRVQGSGFRVQGSGFGV